jgi:hypothetical protein
MRGHQVISRSPNPVDEKSRDTIWAELDKVAAYLEKAKDSADMRMSEYVNAMLKLIELRIKIAALGGEGDLDQLEKMQEIIKGQ